MKTLSNSQKFTLHGHPSQFRNCIVETNANYPSLHKIRVFDCRDKKVKVTEWKSFGNISSFGEVNGEVVQILPYGHNVEKSLKQLPKP